MKQTINLIPKYLLIIFILATVFNISAQDIRSIDSLINEIKVAEKDTCMVKLYLELGTQYESSLPESAFVFYKKALTISEQIESKKFIAKSFMKIGSSYLDQGNYDIAVEYFLKSLENSEELNDNLGISKSLNNIGIVYWYQQNYDKTIEYFTKSLKISEELEDKNGIARSFNNIGMVFSLKGDYEKALENYFKSLKINEELGDKKGISIVDVNMAELNISLKNNAKAVDYAEKSLYLAKEINSLALQKEAFEILVTANYNLQNFRNAYKYHTLFKGINDSIQNETSTSQINEMLTKYESEKKEKENIVLRKDNEIQKLTIEKYKTLRLFFIILTAFIILLIIFLYYLYAMKKKANMILTEKNNLITRQKEELSKTLIQLHELNATKDKFFSIISHDLKSPFQAIIGYSELLKNDKSEFYTEKMKTRVDHIYNAGKSTSYLLSNLLEWSRSQTGMIEFKPVKFYLRNVLEREINILSITLKEKKINILIDISDDIEVFADKNMVRTVLRNLISNAIKFTYVGGNIQIKSKTIGKHVETVVLDTGVGIASENIDKIFNLDCKLSTEGTNNEKGTGIGLILSKEFIEKNRGRIWVESEEGKGSSFIFTLPMSSDVDQ